MTPSYLDRTFIRKQEMHLGELRRNVHETDECLPREAVNMIRACGGEVEVNVEGPYFGSGRAAPLQGADCGWPS